MRGGERAVAEVEQDGHVLRAGVGHDQIDVPVGIEVAGRQRPGAGPDGKTAAEGEASLAVVQEHGYVVGDPVRGDEIEVAVGIEVGGGDGGGLAADFQVDHDGEAALPVVQEHRDLVGVGAGGDQIEVAVGVEIVGDDTLSAVVGRVGRRWAQTHEGTRKAGLTLIRNAGGVAVLTDADQNVDGVVDAVEVAVLSDNRA